uniref:Serine protease gd N-terminal domain-containing protein n=1 Tax=Timema genevievae TaxID=629358 RepID=A0A7R9KA08_TIMGE|nr:unnamed protein product [Timema genevievae]
MLLTVMLFLGSAIHLTTSQPASPCPSVFQYQLDEKGIWSGMVLVPPVPSNVLLKVNVEMFVRASLPSKYAGELLLKDDDEKVVEKFARVDSQPIVYQILFPIQNPLPVITEITANENRICIGSQGRVGLGRGVGVLCLFIGVGRSYSGMGRKKEHEALLTATQRMSVTTEQLHPREPPFHSSPHSPLLQGMCRNPTMWYSVFLVSQPVAKLVGQQDSNRSRL